LKEIDFDCPKLSYGFIEKYRIKLQGTANVCENVCENVCGA